MIHKLKFLNKDLNIYFSYIDLQIKVFSNFFVKNKV